MDTVTDILAFAAAHADYWTEFLSGQDYSSVLSTEEMKALEAARLHVEEGIYELLLKCGAALGEKLKDHGVVTRSFQRGATARNRKVRVDPPASCTKWLYGFEFEFAPDDKNQRILLYASLVVKKGSLDELRRKLETSKTAYKVDDYYIYLEGPVLEKDQRLDALAAGTAGSLGDLFLALK